MSYLPNDRYYEPIIEKYETVTEWLEDPQNKKDKKYHDMKKLQEKLYELLKEVI